MSGLKFLSFLVAAARKLTPRTSCCFLRNSGVSLLIPSFLPYCLCSLYPPWSSGGLRRVACWSLWWVSRLLHIPPDWQCWGWPCSRSDRSSLVADYRFVCLPLLCSLRFGRLMSFSLVVGVCIFVTSSLNMIFGKFFVDGLEESSSRAFPLVMKWWCLLVFVYWQLVVVYATEGPISSPLCRNNPASLMFDSPFWPEVPKS